MGARIAVRDIDPHLRPARVQVLQGHSLSRLGILCASVALTSALLVVGALSGCGYIRVKVTASPVPPTVTAPVQLTMPEQRETATAVPSTPLPTWTPTLTPTPIVHVVQKGDLLIHIASQYNVPMDDIVAINGIVNPHALPIGQRLIIPRSKEDVLALQPTATPIPMPVQVIHVGFHRTPVGSLWCMGEVQNENDESLDLVELRVSLYDPVGALIAKGTAFIVSDIVPGHGVAPFAILLPDASSTGFARYEVTVISAQPIEHWGRRHRSLTIEDLGGEMRTNTYLAQGTVRNRGNADAEDIRITLTAYGEDDLVVGVRQEVLDALPAGQEMPFSLSLIPAAPVIRVDAIAWGLEAQP